MHLSGTIYRGANHTHLSELLSEREGIDLRQDYPAAHPGRRWNGKSSRKRRPPKHRVRRQRRPREGMLIQLDGSHHRWLGEDGPQFALLFAVDDASGAVVNALFCEQEDSLSYFRLDAGTDTAPRHSPGPVRRPPPGLQAPLRKISPPGRQPSSAGPWMSWAYN